jgi:predicted nucleic acid-binding protein
MRVVLDTNILVSALIAPAGNPAAIYNAWEQGKFTLLTCPEHLDELRSTLQKPKVADLIKPYKGPPGQPDQKTRRGHRGATARETLTGPWRQLLAGPGASWQRRLSCDRRQEWPAVARQSQVHADHNRARLRLAARSRRSMNRPIRSWWHRHS